MKKNILTGGFFLLLAAGIQAQDVHYSQMHMAPLLANPAHAGLFAGNFRAHINYRDQWTGFGSPYKTFGGSFDMNFFKDPKQPLPKAHVGTGLHIIKDVAGDANLGITNVSLSTAGILPLNDKNRLSMGIHTGFMQVSADITRLQWENQYDGKDFDPTIPSREVDNLSTPMFADIGAGMVYEFSNKMDNFVDDDITRFSIGISAFHLTKPKYSVLISGIDRLERKYIAHSSFYYDLPNTRIGIVANAHYFLQAKASQTLVGAMARFKFKSNSKLTNQFTESSFYIGANARLGDALIPQMMLDFMNITLGVSYDATMFSRLGASYGMGGGYEISLRYTNVSSLFKGYKG